MWYSTAPTDSTPQATVTNDNMSTDDGYMSFLDKANQDPGQGVAEGQAGGKVELKAVDGGLEVPGAISSVLGKGESFYMSDADEPFVGVALTIGKGEGLPDEGLFGRFPVFFCLLPLSLKSLALSCVGHLLMFTVTLATFAKLVQHPEADKAHVQIMDIGEWDPQGQYKDVVDATREAAKGGDVRVYRIAREGARAEYWVVGVEGDKLVGVKALAVES